MPVELGSPVVAELEVRLVHRAELQRVGNVAERSAMRLFHDDAPVGVGERLADLDPGGLELAGGDAWSSNRGWPGYRASKIWSHSSPTASSRPGLVVGRMTSDGVEAAVVVVERVGRVDERVGAADDAVGNEDGVAELRGELVAAGCRGSVWLRLAGWPTDGWCVCSNRSSLSTSSTAT